MPYLRGKFLNYEFNPNMNFALLGFAKSKKHQDGQDNLGKLHARGMEALNKYLKVTSKVMNSVTSNTSQLEISAKPIEENLSNGSISASSPLLNHIPYPFLNIRPASIGGLQKR